MTRANTLGLIVLLALGLAGCDGRQGVVTPDIEQGFAAKVADPTACPPVEDMCELIAREIEFECPDDGFRNHGQLHSCRKQAVDDHMKSLPDCYTGSERLELKKCVMIAVGLDGYLDQPTHTSGPKLDPHMN